MSKKRISKTKYLAVFATTTLIFLIGLVVGQKIADTKLDKLEQNKNELEQEAEEVRLKIVGLEADQKKFNQDHRDSVSEQEAAMKPCQEKITEIKDEERVLEIKVSEKQKELRCSFI